MQFSTHYSVVVNQMIACKDHQFGPTVISWIAQNKEWTFMAYPDVTVAGMIDNDMFKILSCMQQME